MRVKVMVREEEEEEEEGRQQSQQSLGARTLHTPSKNRRGVPCR